jgi:glycolate oxidase FAD binding subunit
VSLDLSSARPAWLHTDLAAFADEVGATGPVAVEGARTAWSVGGEPVDGTRLVRVPSGIVEYIPAEMTVRCLAGTTVGELSAALSEQGQEVSLPDDRPEATVGGVLAVGRSGRFRLGQGPLRDAVLQVRYVSAEGLVVTAGGPTVKNVAGFDLPRLLVGSLGTLGLLGEVILRTRPRPQVVRWLAGPADPFDLRDRLYRPQAILWDGTTVWLALAGYLADVAAESSVAAGLGLREAAGPPPLGPHRRSYAPGQLRRLPEELPAGGFVAEIGVGTVHLSGPAGPPGPARPLDPALDVIHRRLKANFDPDGRLNPGRDPRRAEAGA